MTDVADPESDDLVETVVRDGEFSEKSGTPFDEHRRRLTEISFDSSDETTPDASANEPARDSSEITPVSATTELPLKSRDIIASACSTTNGESDGDFSENAAYDELANDFDESFRDERNHDVFTLFDTSVECSRCFWPFKTTMTCIYSNSASAKSSEFSSSRNRDFREDISESSRKTAGASETRGRRRFVDGSVEVTFRLSRVNDKTRSVRKRRRFTENSESGKDESKKKKLLEGD